jgi:hypothetical protein
MIIALVVSLLVFWAQKIGHLSGEEGNVKL